MAQEERYTGVTGRKGFPVNHQFLPIWRGFLTYLSSRLGVFCKCVDGNRGRRKWELDSKAVES